MGDELLNREFIRNVLTHEAPWCESHGATDRYLGMGLLYYALVYTCQARVAVCLGSGGGFVPRLMRQAQRDLEIGEQARTILIDANLPEAGWGAPKWLEEDSFFRRSFADVELVLTTTAEAAKQVFEATGLMIDFLHIDADHSFQSCLNDFLCYRRFLHVGSIVTLHDTSLQGAGVCHVVERLRTREDCEVVDMPDIGCGTAILRIVAEESKKRGWNAAHIPPDCDPVITVTRKAEAAAIELPLMGWKYLESEAFFTRSVIAAHFLRECPAVIEIGGGRVTIDAFLTGSEQEVIVVDPLLDERGSAVSADNPCRVQRVRGRFQDIDWRINHPGRYGLVMLGLELQGLDETHRQALYSLINGALVTVIEFPTSWQPSCDQFALIRNNTKTCERFVCKLDLSGNSVGDLENSWPPRFDREIHVLEPVG